MTAAIVAATMPPTTMRVRLERRSGNQNSQPGGGWGHDGSGCQPGGGVHPGGGTGQLGG